MFFLPFFVAFSLGASCGALHEQELTTCQDDLQHRLHANEFAPDDQLCAPTLIFVSCVRAIQCEGPFFMSLNATANAACAANSCCGPTGTPPPGAAPTPGPTPSAVPQPECTDVDKLAGCGLVYNAQIDEGVDICTALSGYKDCGESTAPCGYEQYAREALADACQVFGGDDCCTKMPLADDCAAFVGDFEACAEEYVARQKSRPGSEVPDWAAQCDDEVVWAQCLNAIPCSGATKTQAVEARGMSCTAVSALHPECTCNAVAIPSPSPAPGMPPAGSPVPSAIPAPAPVGASPAPEPLAPEPAPKEPVPAPVEECPQKAEFDACRKELSDALAANRVETAFCAFEVCLEAVAGCPRTKAAALETLADACEKQPILCAGCAEFKEKAKKGETVGQVEDECKPALDACEAAHPKEGDAAAKGAAICAHLDCVRDVKSCGALQSTVLTGLEAGCDFNCPCLPMTKPAPVPVEATPSSSSTLVVSSVALLALF